MGCHLRVNLNQLFQTVFSFQAKNAGNKETIRRGALMKMLQITAQTLPLYVGKTPGGKVPPLCGAVAAEPTYIAKVRLKKIMLRFYFKNEFSQPRQMKKHTN